jgi:HK97 family phage prohead protease
MNTATKHLITVTKAPNAKGTFEGIIDANPPEGDTDGERIASWTNLPGDFILGYQHAYGDPGSQIGSAHVTPKADDRHLLVYGRLDLTSPMARAVHERMLLPSDDSMSLKELSVGFYYDRSAVTKDRNGVTVIENASLHEVSVVWQGAQRTVISGVKYRDQDYAADDQRELALYNLKIDAMAGQSEKEATDTRTLRNHLDSSHAQGVRAYKPPIADLIIRHRLLHADTGPTSEAHIRSGVPDGGTVPVTSVMDDVTRRTRSKSRGSVEAYLRFARDAAARDKLVEQANNTINAKLEADAMAGMTFQEYQQADAERDAWEISKARQEMAQREAERAEEAALLEGATQTAEDFAEVQRRRDAEAVRNLLSQEGETFTMRLGPNGQLEDPS